MDELMDSILTAIRHIKWLTEMTNNEYYQQILKGHLKTLDNMLWELVEEINGQFGIERS